MIINSISQIAHQAGVCERMTVKLVGTLDYLSAGQHPGGVVNSDSLHMSSNQVTLCPEHGHKSDIHSMMMNKKNVKIYIDKIRECTGLILARVPFFVIAPITIISSTDMQTKGPD